MSTTNEPRYIVRNSGSFAGRDVYDTQHNKIILEDILPNEADPLCDLLNAGEAAAQLSAAAQALGAEDGPYTLTKAANGAWCLADEHGNSEWGYPLSNTLTDFVARYVTTEGNAS